MRLARQLVRRSCGDLPDTFTGPELVEANALLRE